MNCPTLKCPTQKCPILISTGTGDGLQLNYILEGYEEKKEDTIYGGQHTNEFEKNFPDYNVYLCGQDILVNYPKKVLRYKRVTLKVLRSLDEDILNKCGKLFQNCTAIQEDEKCPICLDEAPNYALSCGHAFHVTCIAKWKSTCPLCRKIHETIPYVEVYYAPD